MLNVNIIFISHASKPKPPPFQFGLGILSNILRVKGWPLMNKEPSQPTGFYYLFQAFQHKIKNKKTISSKGEKLQNRKSLFVDFSTQSKTKTSKTDIIEHTGVATKQTAKLNLYVHNEHTQFLGFPNLENPQKNSEWTYPKEAVLQLNNPAITNSTPQQK